ncbi:MAG: methyl-accepting chemotaxis protein [Spirochaetaceae bacterium]
MTVRSKLNTAIFLVVGAFLLLIGGLIYSARTAVLLKDLGVATQQVIGAMYRVTDYTKEIIVSEHNLGERTEEWQRATDAFNEALDQLVDHPGTEIISEELAKQIKRSRGVWDVSSNRFVQASQQLTALLEDESIQDFRKTGLNRMLGFAREEGDEQLGLRITALISTLRSFDSAGKELIVGNLGRLADGIERQAGRLTRISFTVVGVAAAIILVAAVLFILSFTRGLSRRITATRGIMERVSEKDLTARARDTHKDELADLTNYTNDVLDALSTFLESVKRATDKAEELKDSLSSGTSESAAALNEISKNIESIGGQFQTLNENVTRSTRAIESIDGKVAGLNESISNQSLAINESASSIEEMNASIQNVSKLSADRKEAADRLTGVILQGGERIQLTNDAIKSVTGEVDDILEIIEIINAISEQTNLLSMNAAIESAHAGEAGKGFAVVAEEIRKLAESTSENASQIDGLLRSITEKIRDALDSSESAAGTFDEINKDISVFSESMGEIVTNMKELSNGSSGILSMTSQIAAITEQIKEAAQEIKTNSGTVREAMASADDLSSEMSNGITEIDRGAKEILGALNDISRISDENRERMEELTRLVDEFRTRGEDGGNSGEESLDELPREEEVTESV